MPLRIVALAIAIACAAGGLFVAGAYPIAPTLVLALFAAWTVFAFVRFSFALPAMLALLPVLAFATRTGWLTFEEFDLLLLASCAGGYAALALRPARAADASRADRPMLSIFAITLVALFAASLTVALLRGFDAAGPFRFGWFQGYDDALNSLRIYKSFVWAIVVTPLLIGELRKPGGFDRLSLGMTTALGLGCIVVLQERLAFTGLLDFSDDYRVTGPFWEMHVGGAALDGFLALTIPFAIREAVRHSSLGAVRNTVSDGRFVAACVVLVLAGYSCLVTFSRGVYVAVPVALLLLVVLVSRQRVRVVRREAWWLIARGGLFALLVAASAFFAFRSGGYRAVLAVLGVLAITVSVEASTRRANAGAWVAAIVAGLLLGAVGHGVAGFLPKGPYVVYALAFAAAVAATLQARRAPSHAITIAAIAAWLWLALSACLVARHWGGADAFVDSAKVLAPWIVASIALSRLARPVWPDMPHRQLAIVGFAGLVMGSVAVFTAGAYMGKRFSTTSEDLNLRTSHWTEGIGRMRGVDTWLFGKGLGRFPATSLFESPDMQVPGSYRLVTRDGETFVSLSAPKVRYLGFGELFRFSQVVAVRPGTAYRVRLQVRSLAAGAVHIEVCERHLLYPTGCAGNDAGFGAALDRWQTVEIPAVTGALGASPWYLPKPVVLAIANGNPGAALEIRSVALIAPDGSDLVANGDFTNGTARWFSSSDKYHLPWHIKNIVLAVLFDQGVIGLALFTLLVGGALLRSTVGRAYRHPDAPYVAAAIAGFLVVGLFDSLLDVPRVAFAFYLVTTVGLVLRNPRIANDGGPAIVTPAKHARADEAAARAKRRQEAFGRRGPSED